MTYQLFTCSYQEYKPEMGLAVRISLGKPKWWPENALHPRAFVWEITPRREYLRASDEEYERQFFGQLERYGVNEIDQKFRQIAQSLGEQRLVLLCFEDLSKNTLCHRRDFASWWKARTGVDIPEVGARSRTKIHPEDTPEPEPEITLW